MTIRLCVFFSLDFYFALLYFYVVCWLDWIMFVVSSFMRELLWIRYFLHGAVFFLSFDSICNDWNVKLILYLRFRFCQCCDILITYHKFNSSMFSSNHYCDLSVCVYFFLLLHFISFLVCTTQPYTGVFRQITPINSTWDLWSYLFLFYACW